MKFTVSKGAAELIAKFEGFSAKPYLDVVKVPTIGYGSTFYENGTKVTMNDPEISKERALELVVFYLNKIALPALENIIVDQCQAQIDALACLIYNIGAGAFNKSSLLKNINTKASLETIQTSWAAWNKAGGKIVKGLVNRRTEEIKHYKC